MKFLFFLLVQNSIFASILVDFTFAPETDAERDIINSVIYKIDKWQKHDQAILSKNFHPIMEEELVPKHEKRRFLRNKAAKYFDRKLQNLLSKAEEKSSIVKSVNETQRKLSKNTKITINKEFKIKFNSNLFQRRLQFEIKNPFLKWNAKYVIGKEFEMFLSKFVKKWQLKTEIKIIPTNKEWHFYLTKKINSKLLLGISSKQNLRDIIFASNSENKIYITYLSSFF